MRWVRCSVLLFLFHVTHVQAIEPADVVLLTNRKVAASRSVAEHYCNRRQVPVENILELDLPTGDQIDRAAFVASVRQTIRAALKLRERPAKVLLSVYGVPLRIGPEAPTATERLELADVQAKLAKTTDEAAKRSLERRCRHLAHAETESSLDSELMLIEWGDYELRRWQLNPLYFAFPGDMRDQVPPVMLTARLDGPTPEIAKRLVDDAIAVEANGLTGRVYIDARGIRFDKEKDNGFGYGGYDESLRETARLLRDQAKMEVTLDDRPELFAPNSCPDCALYCGWYSLANYVKCCKFRQGAVAYHIASAEAVSLRDPNAKYWCKGLLQDGVAATIGPVAEPYTTGFPKPAEFFGYLATGKHTLVECYAFTMPLTSWMMVLIGDPLYKPFAARPALDISKVRLSPVGTQLLRSDR